MVDRTVRVVAAAILALFAVVGAAQSQWSVEVAVPLALVVCGVGLVAAGRAVTGLPLATMLAVAAVAQFVLCHGDPANLGWFGICMVAAWVALDNTDGVAAATCGVLLGGFVVEWVFMSDEGGWGAWIAGTMFTTAACVGARRQRLLVEQLREAQAGLAERSRAEERNRIAAEMHDVIGHALTVSVLHVGSARLSLDEDDPAAARASLQEAERLARESLDEVRAAVGLMRAAEGAESRPLPGAADVAELVDSFRRTGTAVDLDVDGDLSAVGPTRGLAIYRIVQESLTNAARHGDGSGVRVRVSVTGGGTWVSVDSGGRGVVDSRVGAGIEGMQERAEAVGGHLVAGPERSGWRVEAVLPS